MTVQQESLWNLSSYRQLKADVEELKAGTTSVDPSRCALASAFMNYEARLLDGGDFAAWGALFRDDGLYWVPSDPMGLDPATHVSLAFDDRRRIDDRVYWLLSGLATCQIPPSRTTHLIANVEAWPRASGGIYARCNLLLHEFRAGRHRILAGWVGYILQVGAMNDITGVSIQLKVTFLSDADQGHDNLTLVF